MHIASDRGIMKKVTIIIPNYNGKKFLKECLDALETQTSDDFDVLVVENASSDGSSEFIRAGYPWVKLLENETNLGFAGGVNVGIKACKTPYVLLLNNDTKVHSHFVEQMITAIEQSEHIFSVSSKMIQYHDHTKIDDAGDYYNLLGWAFQSGVGHSVKKFRRPKKIFSACAGAAIYRREVFEEIGYFDELHFAYLEDIDVGYRAKLAGYDNIYWPKALVYHVGSGTSGSKYNSFKVKLSARNNVYLNYKNMPNWQLVCNFLPLCVGFAVKMQFFKKIGFGEDYKAGLLEGWQTRNRCKRVDFSKVSLRTLLKIEGELIGNTFLYVFEFLKRKLGV
ncbi:MAG: glycosyltransferase family 2 protein [Lachnospiraceae bacterium]